MIDLSNEWIDHFFEIEVIEYHPQVVGFTGKLDPHPVGMAVHISAATVMIRQPVRHFPPEIFCDAS